MMKFKPGDRVRVYKPVVVSNGTVVATPTNSWIDVRLDWPSGDVVRYHSKQCRLLTKNPRRRVWINFYAGGCLSYFNESTAIRSCHTTCTEGAVEFIEVRPKKK